LKISPFADSVVPLAERHNVILLANHGLVTWVDSPTRAEWCVEIMDNTCRVLILTAQFGVTPTEIPASTVGDLLAMKKELGLPDARFGADQPPAADGSQNEQKVRAITDLVIQAIGMADR
jgi:hypothetical protein